MLMVEKVKDSYYIMDNNYMRRNEYEIDDLEYPTQEFDSAATSINSSKLPAVYSMVSFHPGDIVVDFGGGKFDNAVNYLKDKDVTLLVYDPYNRSAKHNNEVLRILKDNGGADAAVNSNVLNVIKEPEARAAVLRNIKKICKKGAPVYITVYEGKGNNVGGPTKSGYQLNRKTVDYMDEISNVFANVSRKGKLITAINESINYSDHDIIHAIYDAVDDFADDIDVVYFEDETTLVIKLKKIADDIIRYVIKILKAFIKNDIPLEIDRTDGMRTLYFVRTDLDNNEYELVDTKYVLDSDGFRTTYRWYKDNSDGLNFFIFGDDEIIDPEYADWETTSEREAQEWFDSYVGFDEEE